MLHIQQLLFKKLSVKSIVEVYLLLTVNSKFPFAIQKFLGKLFLVWFNLCIKVLLLNYLIAVSKFLNHVTIDLSQYAEEIGKSLSSEYLAHTGYCKSVFYLKHSRFTFSFCLHVTNFMQLIL